MNHELNEFIRSALGKGLARDKIKQALLEAKWPVEEVDEAMSRFAEIDFPLPVPRRKPYLSAREAFLYLLVYITLYTSAFNFGSLVFQFINRAYPDLVSYDNYYRGNISFALASLVIAFPIYLLLSWYLERKAKQSPEIRTSRVRKWLTYFTLFSAAAVIIGDLIALFNQLFNGELSVRFGLKFITILVIAGLIFWYY